MASFPHPLLPLPAPCNPKASISASWKPTMKPAAAAASTSPEPRLFRDGSPTTISGKRPWWTPPFLPQLVHMQASGQDEASYPADEASTAAGPEGSAKNGRKQQAGMTAEKARLLRREMRATQTWHDAMYHSAIASRLASPDDDGPTSLL